MSNDDDPAGASARPERRLAAILAADVVGYSGLVERDEEGTLERLRALLRDVVRPAIDKHRGRLVKTTGDGLIAEFASPVEAVRCAVRVQQAAAERNGAVPEDRWLTLRMGVNLGDILSEGGDVFGDGVNIAARLESLAEAGGVLVSRTVHDHVQGRLPFRFEDLGDRNLKNITRPVRVYRVGWQPHPGGRPDRSLPPRPALPNKASIAVLPFANMSSDPEQEYFADGLAEDLITDLSKVPGLLVIARNSSFAYKGPPADVRSIARDLGVRYVIEGSVRRAASRVRINAQLIDATDNSHLWADRFDRDLADIFSLQDEVVGKIISALAHALPSAHPIRQQRATNVEAYDLFVRARVLAMQSPEGSKAALPLLEKAIELDPDFAGAHAWLAMSHHFGWEYWGHAVEHNRSLARIAARQAMLLDPENADAHLILGYVRAYEGDLAAGIAELGTALRINPSHADAWALLTDLTVLDGRATDAIDCAQNAFRLNPHRPGVYYWVLGFAEYAAGRYEDAVATLRHEAAPGTGSQCILAASLAQLGRIEEAREEARQYMAAIPHFTVQHWASTQHFRHESDRQHFVDGYIKAGLPG